MGSRTRSPANDRPPPEIGPGTLYWRKIPDQAFTLFARKARTLKLLAVFAYLRRNNLRELAVENGELMRLSDQSEGSVDRALADLETAGWIERRRQRGQRVIVFHYDLATGPAPENGQCLHSSDALNAFRASDECIPRQRCMHSSDLRIPYKEGKTSVQTEEKDVPSLLPPPIPEPAAPMVAKTDGTGRVSPVPIPEPDPADVALWEQDKNRPGHRGVMARWNRAILAAARREREAPPAPETPVQAPARPTPPPAPSAAVQLATPATPIVEGRCPPPRGRLWPNEDGFPRAALEREVRALAEAPDRDASAASIARKIAGRFREPGNARSVETFTRGLLGLSADHFLGLWHEAEQRKWRHPNRKLAQWIAQEAPPLADLRRWGANAPAAGCLAKATPTAGVQRSSAS